MAKCSSRPGDRAAAYDTAGYLKWFHGVSLNAILVLPILAWWLSRTRRSEARRTQIIAAAVTSYVLVAVVTLIVSLIAS